MLLSIELCDVTGNCTKGAKKPGTNSSKIFHSQFVIADGAVVTNGIRWNRVSENTMSIAHFLFSGHLRHSICNLFIYIPYVLLNLSLGSFATEVNSKEVTGQGWILHETIIMPSKKYKKMCTNTIWFAEFLFQNKFKSYCMHPLTTQSHRSYLHFCVGVGKHVCSDGTNWGYFYVYILILNSWYCFYHLGVVLYGIRILSFQLVKNKKNVSYLCIAYNGCLKIGYPIVTSTVEWPLCSDDIYKLHKGSWYRHSLYFVQ